MSTPLSTLLTQPNMSTTIILDSSLTPRIHEENARWKPSHLDRKQALSGITYAAKMDDHPLVRDHIKGSIYHSNYLTYLEVCWANHYTPVITPDILWFGLLNEIASLIRENPEAVRSLFSTTTEKQKIIVPTGDPELMPLDLIIDQLRGLVPSNTDAYLPTFTTTTPDARFAHYAAFCDAVSPYYEYGMMLCGFPAIQIWGTLDDYVKLTETWCGLPTLLSAQAPKFFAQVQKTLEELVIALHGVHRDTEIGHEAAREWFGQIFSAKKCGSGHQTKVDGWITQLQRVQPKGPRYASNFAPQIAKVKYEELMAKRKFTMLYGMFSSELVDGVAIPSFAPLVFEHTPAKKSRDSQDALVFARATLGSIASS